MKSSTDVTATTSQKSINKNASIITDSLSDCGAVLFGAEAMTSDNKSLATNNFLAPYKLQSKPTNSLQSDQDTLSQGYFLSPQQCQEMVEQYVKNLALASRASSDIFQSNSLNSTSPGQFNANFISEKPDLPLNFPTLPGVTPSTSTAIFANFPNEIDERDSSKPISNTSSLFSPYSGGQNTTLIQSSVASTSLSSTFLLGSPIKPSQNNGIIETQNGINNISLEKAEKNLLTSDFINELNTDTSLLNGPIENMSSTILSTNNIPTSLSHTTHHYKLNSNNDVIVSEEEENGVCCTSNQNSNENIEATQTPISELLNSTENKQLIGASPITFNKNTASHSEENTDNSLSAIPQMKLMAPEKDPKTEAQTDLTGENSAFDMRPKAEFSETQTISVEPETKNTTTEQTTETVSSTIASSNATFSTTPETVNGSDQDRRTSDLIKKQINEIEKEISRRIQNKNIKKIDENELAQLLSDHGFGNFVGPEPIQNLISGSSISASVSEDGDRTGLPYCSSITDRKLEEEKKPSLNKLKSSFSPPLETAPSNVSASTNIPLQHNSFPNTLYPYSQSGSFIPGNFVPTNNIFPQHFATPNVMDYVENGTASFLPPQYVSNGIPLTMNLPPSAAANFAAAFAAHSPQLNSISQAFQPTSLPQGYTSSASFYAHHMPQQHLFQGGAPAPINTSVCHTPSPPLATMLPPTLSAITPEMAAALLQQLQQQNPALIQNLVEQQRQQQQNSATSNSSPPTMPTTNGEATIPALPPPQNNVVQHQPKKVSKPNIFKNPNNGKPVGNLIPDESEWTEFGNRHNPASASTSVVDAKSTDTTNGTEPVWVMRDSYLKRLKRDEQRSKESNSSETTLEGLDKPYQNNSLNGNEEEEEAETDKLLAENGTPTLSSEKNIGRKMSCTNSFDVPEKAASNTEKNGKKSSANTKKEVMVHEPAVLIEGVLFRAHYLGSTQLSCDGRPTKTSRMAQAQEAVGRVKAPEGEIQPSTEIDLFISTEKIMVLNTDLQRISETDVRQDILMDHALRSISYIADIGDLVVLMVRRMTQPNDTLSPTGINDELENLARGLPRVVCHVFESDEASFIAQSIGQAFQVAYVEFLRANGIDDPAYLREIDYQEVLNSQELMGEELEMFARKETQKDVIIPKKVGEPLGVVVVESGWGSMLPTVVVANMAPGGPAARSNHLNIGDQIIAINGISLVGLPLAKAQQNIRNAKSSTAVRLTVVSAPPVVEVRIKRPDTKYQLGFSVQNGVICSLLRGGIAERGGIRVGHRIIEINNQSAVAVPHDKIVNVLATATGEIHMKTMPTSMFRLLTGQEVPNYI